MEHADFGNLVLVLGDVSSEQPWQHLLSNDAGVTNTGGGSGTADKVWCRWLLTWLSHGDVEKVLEHASNATKTGGKVMVWDYFNEQTFDLRSSLADGAPCWQLVKDTLMQEWHTVGDPSVCGRVPQLLGGVGFAVEEITPLAPIIRAGSAEWVWPSTYFKTQAKRLVEAGAIPPDANPAPAVSVETPGGADCTFLQRFEREWQVVSRDPAAWYTPPMMAAVVARKV